MGKHEIVGLDLSFAMERERKEFYVDIQLKLCHSCAQRASILRTTSPIIVRKISNIGCYLAPRWVAHNIVPESSAEYEVRLESLIVAKNIYLVDSRD